MHPKLMYHVIFLTFITNTKCHTAVNSSDVIIVGGHADANDEAVFITTPRSTTKKSPTTPYSDSDDDDVTNDHHQKKNDDEDKDKVLFLPTDKYAFGNDETVHEDTIRMSDVLENKRLSGIRETEKPGDILFIQGKNNERQNSPVVEGRRRQNGEDREEFKYIDYEEEETTTVTTPIPLDCTNLDCDNDMNSICGGKMERSEMKYRLFKNECYFRKVNCAFSYEMNRYLQVDLIYCKNIATHVTRKPYDYPMYFPIQEPRRHVGKEKEEQQGKELITRRFNGRRSMVMNLGASFCAHPCPTVCTDHYEPECALSSLGERRVFTNHCTLDLNSCQYRLLWRRRPLSECTGNQKADLHQNRAFIDWMQRSGIVDKKGKLVLNK